LRTGANREDELKSFFTWLAFAVIACAVLIIAHDPAYWRRQVMPHVTGHADLPEAFYKPRVIVHGSARPPAPRETPESEQLTLQTLQAAADYAGNHHSMALIVSRHGYLVFEKYWQGSNLDTVVDSRGLGRVVAALATGVAISDRKIAWPDEPIGYFMPELHDNPRGAITVRNLLQLSSGLGDAGASDDEPEPVNNIDMVQQYLKLSLGAQPGTRWRDQSSDPDMLAFIIQKATGQSYPEYVAQNIWSRVGSGDASLWLDHAGGVAHADRGFFARQGDWMRIAELLLQNGNYQGDEVVVPKWGPQMLQPAKSNDDYGMYVRRGVRPESGMTPYVTDDVYLVSGGGNRLWFVPSLQLAILRTGPTTGIDWDDGQIPNLIIRGAHDFVPSHARPGADIRQLVPNH
jgi:CubicO group peptidase (beta-lactamase class C family)